MTQINTQAVERQFSSFSHFIIWCACVDVDILKSCSRGIVMKYMALGFLILTPAVFAFPASAFFIKTAFFPVKSLVACVFG